MNAQPGPIQRCGICGAEWMYAHACPVETRLQDFERRLAEGWVPPGRPAEDVVADLRVVHDLKTEVERLRALVYQLGMHLSALCDHPTNYERRYDTSSGAPCAGCYDARDAYQAWRAEQ